MSEIYDIQHLQKHIRGYQNKRVLVTGSSGFFGRWMISALYNDCDLFLAKHDNNMGAILQGGGYDYIFHFAPTPIEPVIECAKRSNAKILYASSGAVYGGIQERVTEEHPTNPITDYGYEKLRSENVLKKSGLDYCIARLFAFCGAGMKNNFAITKFVEAAKTGKPLMVYGNPTRTYMYIVDAIEWLCKLMLSENGVYNVGGEKETTIRDLAKRVSTYKIPNAEILLSSKEFIQNANYYVPDCSKAHDLGLEQNFSLSYGIERMME